MPVALVDSNVVIGRASVSDDVHEPSTEIVSGIDHGELPTGRLTNYVVAETLNFLRERRGQAYATDVYERLNESSGFEIVHASRSDFTTAVEIFQRHDGLSFVDATLVAYARRTDVEYCYSFDDDFDAVEGITRLNAATDPYA